MTEPRITDPHGGPLSPSADDLLVRWLLRQYCIDGSDGWLTGTIAESPVAEHLRTCPDATIGHGYGYSGVYGCNTGCETVEFTATITCPHGHADEFSYGEFGDIPLLLQELEREAGQP